MLMNLLWKRLDQKRIKYKGVKNILPDIPTQQEEEL